MGSKRFARALVTGASSGIGEAFARQLGAAGTDLVIVARSKERLDALAGELADEHHISVEVLAADLIDREQLAGVERRVRSNDEPIDLLINNAGFGNNGLFADADVNAEDSEIQLNVVALMRLCHAAIGRMKEAGGGSILNVSSTGSFQPTPGLANYAATKAYVTSFSQALHEELVGTGVVVTALCPGVTHTEFQARGGFSNEGIPSFLWQTADEVAAAGLSAVAAGRAVETPGLHNKALRVTTRLAPMSVVRWSAGQVLRRYN